MQLLTGQTLSFRHDPFAVPFAEACTLRRQGGVLIEAGRIRAVDEAETLRAAHPQAEVISYGADLICAGFVDAHVHYPQTAIIASWGLRLIDWLNTYTFPEEARFRDPGYAAEIAARYLDLTAAQEEPKHEFKHEETRVEVPGQWRRLHCGTASCSHCGH